MKKLWIKFSDERNRKYSIRTTILRDQLSGQKFVTKEAIFPEGKDHLRNIVKYHDVLERAYSNSKMCPVEFKDERLWFEFIEGQSLEEKYQIAVKEKDDQVFCELLRLHVSLICGDDSNDCVFASTPEFESIFGEGTLFNGKPGLKISNFDAISSNIIFANIIPTFIDYEWVFLQPLPKELVVFHCIKDLYLHIHGLEKFYPLQKAMEYLEIDESVETLDGACKQFFHNVISEEDGRSFAGAKHLSLRGERDVQDIVEDSKNAHQEWLVCAKHWEDAVKANKELQKVCDEIEQYWKQSSQANAVLNSRLVETQRKLEEATNGTIASQNDAQQWKMAYETLVNSRTWRLANKIKRVFGRGR